MKTVLVIGGGASGMMAAITAAGAGASVTLLEKMKKPGRKLLLTGNGRCNLTNLDPELQRRYYSDSDSLQFTEEVFRQFGVRETLLFFEEAGLHWTERGGCVYPRSGQASTVLSVLEGEMRRLKVKLKYDSCAEEIAYDPERHMWSVRAGGWNYRADSLILCAGSRAYPSTGSDGSGYVLGKMAGHTCVPPRPALTGLYASEREKRLLKLADGARTYGHVRLLSVSGQVLAEEEGEIQWTAYGVSGIVIFQLSRSFPGDAEEAELMIDLVPDKRAEEIAGGILRTMAHCEGQCSVGTLLEGYVNGRVAAYLEEKNAACLTAEPDSIARMLKEVRIRVSGPRPFENAQVCAGGIPLSEVFPETLGSRCAPSLYLAGEVLDIDGPCGGYNLQWAWSSGTVAGRHAAAER